MRTSGLAFVALGLFLTSCNRDRPRDPAARQVGKEAYRASQELKHDAKKAAQELHKAGKEMRQGWNEARREDTTRRNK